MTRPVPDPESVSGDISRQPTDWDDLLPPWPGGQLSSVLTRFAILGAAGQWHRSKAWDILQDQPRFSSPPGDIRSFCAWAMYARWPTETLPELLHAEWSPDFALWKKRLFENPRIDPMRLLAMTRAAGIADTVIPISRRGHKAPGTTLLWHALEDPEFRARAKHLVLSEEALSELRAEEVLAVHEVDSHLHLVGDDFSLRVHLRAGLDPFRLMLARLEDAGCVSRGPHGVAVHLASRAAWCVLERRP